MLNLYLYTLLGFVSIIIPVLIAVAFTTLIERKVMAAMQNRRGPNVMGFYGLYQPITDGFKLLLKEPLVPYQANKIIFIFSPILVSVLSFMSWSIVPIAEKTNIINIDTGVLFLLGISSINVYGILLAGWASNSKYAFVGGLRAAAQMISYEVSLSLSILPVVLLSGDTNLTEIVYQQRFFWFVFPLFPSAVILSISASAETNRTPFDSPEAEGELVAGFNVEYSGFGFALFLLAEYANILLMSALFVIFFLGGWYVGTISWSGFFIIKMVTVLFFFVWIRATAPRYRYDQSMQIGWKVFLPFTTGYFLLVAGVLHATIQMIVLFENANNSYIYSFIVYIGYKAIYLIYLIRFTYYFTLSLIF